ncbi:hypothetical protein [Streptomyces sp. NBC_00207]|uniref:hypothetical protein n=1 Tax=Streptomyces sp. NBC_00207 TaxID=2903635 RepID=UPI003254682E
MGRPREQLAGPAAERRREQQALDGESALHHDVDPARQEGLGILVDGVLGAEAAASAVAECAMDSPTAVVVT